MNKFSFSGHESFQCRTQWLKKGYDFVKSGNNFNDIDSVIKLGVGKNMVSSIKYWLKVFGITNNDNELTDIAHYIFDDNIGKDPFLEDNATLWLLHYMLIKKEIASIYALTFVDFHKERNDFDREHIQGYIKRKCIENNWQYLYNENTVKKDIGVFLQNYVEPQSSSSYEDFSAIFIDLNLIKRTSNKSYTFNYINEIKIPAEILLYTIINDKKGNSISFDSLVELALIFCLSPNDLLELIKEICLTYPQITFSDVAGIKELQFKSDINKEEVLNHYFDK